MIEKNSYFIGALENYVNSKGVNSCYYLNSDNINFITLFEFLFTDSILCNNIYEVDEYFFENIELYEIDEEEEEYPEFYQYYIVNIDEWRLNQYKEYLKENNLNSDINLFYSDKLENYVCGISHFGTSWACVPTSIKINKEGEE